MSLNLTRFASLEGYIGGGISRCKHAGARFAAEWQGSSAGPAAARWSESGAGTTPRAEHRLLGIAEGVFAERTEIDPVFGVFAIVLEHELHVVDADIAAIADGDVHLVA